jgi:hypothetical protein
VLRACVDKMDIHHVKDKEWPQWRIRTGVISVVIILVPNEGLTKDRGTKYSKVG